jgi:hypothetical protein
MDQASTAPASNNTPVRKRPTWVWVISVVYSLSFLYTCLSFYLCLSGAIPLNAAQKAYFEGLTALDWAFTTVIGMVSLGAAVFLFLLRRQALYLFGGSLVLNFCYGAYTLHKTWTFLSATPGAAVGMFLGWGIGAAICLYTWKLTKAGTLT